MGTAALMLTAVIVGSMTEAYNREDTPAEAHSKRKLELGRRNGYIKSVSWSQMAQLFNPFGSTPTPPTTTLDAAYSADGKPTKAVLDLTDPLSMPITHTSLAPIVFYTGLTGSALYADLDKPTNWWGDCGGPLLCGCKTSSSYLLYFSFSQILAHPKCMLSNMALLWDYDANGGAGDIKGKPGVKITTENSASGGQPNGATGGFDPNGRGMALAGCDPNLQNCNPFRDMMWQLIQKFGYSMAQFRTVVYDYRLGANQWRAPVGTGDQLYETGNFDQHKQMLEDLYEQLGHRAMLITLSEGGTMVKCFLDTMTQEWKDKYIEGWMSYSGVFAGASDMAWSQMSGLPFYSNMIKTKTGGLIDYKPFTTEEFQFSTRNLPGQAMVSPARTGNDAADNMVLFSTPSRNYTYLEYAEAVRANGLNSTAAIFDSVRDVLPTLDPPGVRMWCIYANNFATPVKMTYDFDFDGNYNPKQPTIEYGDGDGTVHMASLKVCDRWTTPSDHPFVTQYVQNSLPPSKTGPVTTTHEFIDTELDHSGVLTKKDEMDNILSTEILYQAIGNIYKSNKAADEAADGTR